MIKMLNLVSATSFVDLFYKEIEERIPYPTIASMVTNELDYSLVRQVVCDIMDEYAEDKYAYVDAYSTCDKLMTFEQAYEKFGSKLARPVLNVITETLSDVIASVDVMAKTEFAPAVSYEF